MDIKSKTKITAVKIEFFKYKINLLYLGSYPLKVIEVARSCVITQPNNEKMILGKRIMAIIYLTVPALCCITIGTITSVDFFNKMVGQVINISKAYQRLLFGLLF